MIAVASSPAHRSTWRPALAALAGAVALLAGVAAALGVFVRGDGGRVLPSPACHADRLGAATLLTHTRRNR